MSVKIGVPRALMYHYYYPMWKSFFNELELELILSPETNKKILDQGVRIAVDDICLPFKVYYGHVLDLIGKVDYIFVPRFISLGKYNYVCPKFMGLPDMLKATIKDLPELIEPVIDLRKGFTPLRKIAMQIGKRFKKGFWEIERAYRKAVKVQSHFDTLQIEGNNPTEAIEKTLCKYHYISSSLNRQYKIKHSQEIQDYIAASKRTDYNQLKNSDGINRENSVKKLNITVLGHAYILNDNFISMNIIKHLKELGAEIKTVEMFDNNSLEDAAALQEKKVFWYFNRKVMGAAYNVLTKKDQLDGIVQVTAFGCGPDSLVKELIDIRGKRSNVSILNINLDEHSGEAGLLTRLEAFVDLLERRKIL
ncbi:MAG: acyl-CoA dehydratase activase-related protein [Halanaerobiales bacterium]